MKSKSMPIKELTRRLDKEFPMMIWQKAFLKIVLSEVMEDK